MFLKVTSAYKGKKYLSYVQGYRDIDGKIKHKTIEKIGYLDDLKLLYNDPISHFKAELEKKKLEEPESLSIKSIKSKMITESDCSKNLGYCFLKYIYNELAIPEILNEKQTNTKLEFNLNEIFSLLVFSRILFPDSKKATYELKNKYFEKYDFSLNNLYRSLDYFKDFKEDLEINFWNLTKDRYNRDITKTYYDCTNYYFEVEYNDDDIFDKDNNLIKKGYRKRGPEKNHRPDPIVEMGLLMDASGLPIAYNLFPGNESEKLSLIPEINRLKNKFGVKRTIVVADRGLNCSENVIKISGLSFEQSLKMNGYLYGQSVRGADKEFKDWVLAGGYTESEIIENGEKIKFIHKSRVYPKTMYVIREDKGKTKSGNPKKEKVIVDQKQMVYYSQKYADKQKRDRDKMIEKAKDLIANPEKYTRATSYGASGYVKNISFVDATGEIAQGKELTLDKSKIEEEKKFDGYYSIVTSEEKLSDIEIRNIYRGLAKIEETFKVTKSLLNARPAYVWTPEHIEAHFLTCFVALLITRILELKLENKYSPERIVNSLKNYTSSNIEHDVYLQSFCDDIIVDCGKIFNINLNRKYLYLSEIKKILKKV